jgi:hypothetical protein
LIRLLQHPTRGLERDGQLSGVPVSKRKILASS